MTRKIFLFEIFLVVAALAATLAAWPHLPSLVPTHWNLRGLPDRQNPREMLFLIGPGFLVGWMLLTWLLPWLSPKSF